MYYTLAFMGYCFQGTNPTATVSLSKRCTQIVIFHPKLPATSWTGKLFTAYTNLEEKPLKYSKVCAGQGKPGKS